MKRFVTETDDTGKSTTVTLPEYVNRICADNTAQAEQLVEYRDFMRDMCHTLGMSLESTFADVLRRVEKLKVSSPSVPSERALTGAEKGLYSVATAEDWAAQVDALNVKLCAKQEEIETLEKRLASTRSTKEYYLSEWSKTANLAKDRCNAVQRHQAQLEEYRADNAALNRQVEEYRSVAFGLWESLEKARSSEPPALVSVPSEGLFPGSWVEVR